MRLWWWDKSASLRADLERAQEDARYWEARCNGAEGVMEELIPTSAAEHFAEWRTLADEAREWGVDG